MCGDYGFRSGTGKIYEETDGTIPDSIWTLVRAASCDGLSVFIRSRSIPVPSA